MSAMQPRTRKDRQIAVRVPEDLWELLDAEARRLQAERPGMTVRRSDAVREALYRALRRSGPGNESRP